MLNTVLTEIFGSRIVHHQLTALNVKTLSRTASRIHSKMKTIPQSNKNKSMKTYTHCLIELKRWDVSTTGFTYLTVSQHSILSLSIGFHCRHATKIEAEKKLMQEAARLEALRQVRTEYINKHVIAYWKMKDRPVREQDVGPKYLWNCNYVFISAKELRYA